MWLCGKILKISTVTPGLLQFHLCRLAEIQAASVPVRPELCRSGNGQSTKIASHLSIYRCIWVIYSTGSLSRAESNSRSYYMARLVWLALLHHTDESCFCWFQFSQVAGRVVLTPVEICWSLAAVPYVNASASSTLACWSIPMEQSSHWHSSCPFKLRSSFCFSLC